MQDVLASYRPLFRCSFHLLVPVSPPPTFLLPSFRSFRCCCLFYFFSLPSRYRAQARGRSFARESREWTGETEKGEKKDGGTPAKFKFAVGTPGSIGLMGENGCRTANREREVVLG